MIKGEFYMVCPRCGIAIAGYTSCPTCGYSLGIGLIDDYDYYEDDEEKLINED